MIYSGGSGFNCIAKRLSDKLQHCCHVLPISDDGGSSAEIIRVLRGPAIGDIRNRLLRLADSASPEAQAVRSVLQHRLPNNALSAKHEWGDIIDGTHSMWLATIRSSFKQTIRSFLIEFNTAVCKHAGFDFRNGSIGNFFFTGSRIYFVSPPQNL